MMISPTVSESRRAAQEHSKSSPVHDVAMKVERADKAMSPWLCVSGTDHERVRKVFTEQLAGFKLTHNIP